MASLQLELRDGDGDAENGEAAARALTERDGDRDRSAGEESACAHFLKSVVDKKRLGELEGRVSSRSEAKSDNL